MIPKKINKMSIEEQEAYLIQKLNELYNKENIYRQALAMVRGKVKIEVSEEDRPDLIAMKIEN